MKLAKRQYLLCKKGINKIYKNDHIQFEGYELYFGKEIDISYIKNETMFLLIIGYILDPTSIKKNNEDILVDIKHKIIKGELITEIIKKYGGRWILISIANKQMIVLNDACGLRQVFYSFRNQSFILSSQDKCIANLMGLKKNSEAVNYINKAKSQYKEYSWPLNATEYNGIRRLLPNHFINVTEKRVRRYWPSKKRELFFTDEIIKISSYFLKNQLKAASYRKRIVVTLTAGLDTRLLFASSIDIKNNILYVTHISKAKEDIKLNEDAEVAQALCELLEAKHQLIKYKDKMSRKFERKFYAANEHGHAFWGPLFETINTYKLSQYLWVKGSCCEIARNPFGIIDNRHVTPKLLCYLFDIPYNEFSFRIISDWINRAKSVCDRNEYMLLDLFYWEHRMGSWQAMCQNEADLVQETFTPFNTRSLLEKFLEAPVEERIAPEYKVFIDIIKKLSPQAMVYSINPKRYRSLSRKLLIKIKFNYPLIYIFLRRLKNLNKYM